MSLEVVVRPVVFPNIRPARPRVLPAPDDPNQGIVVLSGGGGGTFVGTSYSYSYSYSSSAPHKEKKRQVDKKRVYQKTENADGSSTINKDVYVDIETANKFLLEIGSPNSLGTGAGSRSDGPLRLVYGPFKDADNVEVLEKDVTKTPGQS